MSMSRTDLGDGPDGQPDELNGPSVPDSHLRRSKVNPDTSRSLRLASDTARWQGASGGSPGSPSRRQLLGYIVAVRLPGLKASSSMPPLRLRAADAEMVARQKPLRLRRRDSREALPHVARKQQVAVRGSHRMVQTAPLIPSRTDYRNRASESAPRHRERLVERSRSGGTLGTAGPRRENHIADYQAPPFVSSPQLSSRCWKSAAAAAAPAHLRVTSREFGSTELHVRSNEPVRLAC